VPRIQDLALIGDCKSAALVSTEGEITWLCCPRFDSAAVFGALLDPAAGSFKIAPAAPLPPPSATSPRPTWWSPHAHELGRGRADGPHPRFHLGGRPGCGDGAFARDFAPRQPRGRLNWDYRYGWLRDASLTTRALDGLGCDAEADAFVDWLLHATRLTRPRLSVLHDVYGDRPRTEGSLGLFGHAGSRPVRIGNAAVDQLQLDVYGEVIHAATQKTIVKRAAPDRETRALLLGNEVARGRSSVSLPAARARRGLRPLRLLGGRAARQLPVGPDPRGAGQRGPRARSGAHRARGAAGGGARMNVGKAA
jgi:hypothetical protein